MLQLECEHVRFLRGVPVRRRLCSGCKLSGYRGFMYLKCFVEAIRCPELFLGLCLILCLRSRRVVHCARPRQLLLLQRSQLHRGLDGTHDYLFWKVSEENLHFFTGCASDSNCPESYPICGAVEPHRCGCSADSDCKVCCVFA